MKGWRHNETALNIFFATILDYSGRINLILQELFKFLPKKIMGINRTMQTDSYKEEICIYIYAHFLITYDTERNT